MRKRVYARGCTARRLAGRAPQEHVAPNVTSDSFRSIELFMQLPFAGTDVARITQGRSRVLRDSLLSLLQIIFKKLVSQRARYTISAPDVLPSANTCFHASKLLGGVSIPSSVAHVFLLLNVTFS